MLTWALYNHLAGLLKEGAGSGAGLYIAVGAGDPAWDRGAPPYRRDIAALLTEVARKAVGASDVQFLDERGAETPVAGRRLRIRALFEAGEGEGALRECGLFAAVAGARPNSGLLLSYFMHARIDKGPQMSLARAFHLDLTPHPAGGAQPTRYLGNSRTREVHDLDHPNPACQIGEILFDRRLYFATPEQAVELGYDRCAFCFGRGQSQR
jgi:hypothetical protein